MMRRPWYALARGSDGLRYDLVIWDDERLEGWGYVLTPEAPEVPVDPKEQD